MKRILIIASMLVLIMALIGDMALANTGMHFMRIGRLWVNAEYDGAEGWSGQYAWPGGYISGAYTGIRELFGGNVRKTGTLAGCTNWTGPNGTVYPFWTSGMYRSYDYDYLPYWKDQDHQTALYPVTQVLWARWPQPEVFVDGVNITPDGGDGFLTLHEGNTGVDPNLVTERAIQSVWRYSMGVEYERWLYGYSNPNHQDYAFYDITFTNNGKVYGLDKDPPDLWPYVPPEYSPAWPQILEGQTVENFWWAQMMNPWNSRLGRGYSISTGNDEWGEFVAPFADQPDRHFYLCYDGDKQGDGVKDFADPSNDERWIELLSPAWLCVGAVYADQSPTNKVDDPTQPKSTSIHQERDYDLGRVVKTFQDQYQALFNEQKWPLDTPHPEIDAAISIPSCYVCFGPYDLAFGQSVNITYVIAAGGLDKETCRSLGRQAWDASFSGPIMDEIETQFMTSRDSVFKALQAARWNVTPSQKGGRAKFDVPDAPRPPAKFMVSAEGPRIKLEWTDESRNDPDFDTGVQDFAGYRVYKAVGARDSTYRVIYDGQANQTYDDDVSGGFQYFYYVVAYDDGSQNWENPGVSLECSKYYCWTGWAPLGASPATDPLTDGSKMDDIRVVPNPYSAAGKTYPGEVDKINFTGLPAECTITIFTTNGDYVHKIEHTDGSGSESWDLQTEFNQYIVSDVYIYTVKSDLGDHVGKFIVIR